MRAWASVGTATSAWGDLYRYRALVRNLVFKDLKLKYRGSVLGFVWSLLHPLLLLAVYTIAFKYVVRIRIENYPLFVLAGLLPWTFFAGALLSSTGAIVGNGHLVKEIHFPREVLPIASVLFNFAQFGLALAVLLPVLLLVSREGASAGALLLLPVLLALHFLFIVGVALALSGLTVFFRDVAHLTEVGVVLLFWLTPVVYAADMAPRPLQLWFTASPPAAFTTAYQDLLFWGRVPSAGVVATILVATAASVLAGHAVFRRLSPAFAEEV